MHPDDIKKKLEACYMDIRELLYFTHPNQYELHAKLADVLKVIRYAIGAVPFDSKGLLRDDDC